MFPTARTVRSSETEIDLKEMISELVAYCRANQWAGYDPYDALNSPVFGALPFLNHRVVRLLFTQALKRSPVNFRSWLRIPNTRNPKAIALFLSAFLTLERVDDAAWDDDIATLIEVLHELRSPGTDYWCWGYSFPWQTRSILVPRGAPNLVCTCFVANALLQAAEQGHDSRCLAMGLSAARYIVDELYWSDGSRAGFSYPVPSLRTQVHNANLLAAALLCRAYSHTKDEKFLTPALQGARHVASNQGPDGSWYYGEAASQRWIDNFHTGYNLCALHAISQYTSTQEFDSVLQKGFAYYREHFFRKDNSVKYFHDRTYPVDAHCVAQSILTLVALKDLDPGNLVLAQSVLRWATAHLWNYQGFFYYQKLRAYTNRISYMRWSQAWMLLAMATLLEASNTETRSKDDPCLALVAGGTA